MTEVEDEPAPHPGAATPGPGLGRRVRGLVAKDDSPPLRAVTAEAGWYPLVILTTLNFVDELDHAVIAVFAPNIQRYFGLNNTALGALIGVQVALVILVAIPIGYWSTKLNRARVLRTSAAIWGVCSTATAFAIHLPTFVATRLGTGAGKAAVEPVGKSLLTDYYPPYGWNRVLAVHNAANPAGAIVGPLLAGAIGLLIAGDDVWRWAFPILTIPTFVALIAARRLAEPKVAMVKSMGAQFLTVTMAPSDMRFRDAVARLVRIPTFRRQMVGIGIMGFALVGVMAFASLLLEDEFGVGEGGRGLIVGILATASLLGTLIGGRVGERIFAQSPALAVRTVGSSIALFSIVLAAAVFSPTLLGFVVVMWIGIAVVSVTVAPLGAILTAISPPRLRPLMFSLLGVCVALFGGIFGGLIVGSIADLTNLRVGLAALAPFGIIGGLIMRRGSLTIEADIEAITDEA